MLTTAFHKLSDNESPNMSLVLSGLGTRDAPSLEFVSWLVRCHELEVHHFDRQGDVLLAENPQAIEVYIKAVREFVDAALQHEKSVHLLGISFGGYLSLRIAEEVGKMVGSIVTLAPLIDPYETLMRHGVDTDNRDMIHVELLDGLSIDILRGNAEGIRNRKF